IDRPTLDWTLRAANPPFDGLQDLINEYRLGQLTDTSTIEIVAYNVAAVDGTSNVNGQTANFQVRTSLGLSPEKFSTGYRVLTQGKVVDRGNLGGDRFQWTDHADHRVGLASFAVPRAAVVQAIPQYGGIAQQFYWFTDPATAQNPRMAAFDAFDPKLEV